MIKTKNSSHHIPLLLTANLYLFICLFSISILDVYACSLNKRLYETSSVDDDLFCRLRGYFSMVAIGGIFYSNMLQAIFRLCRIVFHTQPLLQKFKLYCIMVIVQWIISCLSIIPNFLLNDFEYFLYDFQCAISFFNRRGLYYSVLMTYLIPIVVTIGSYIYTVRKTRQMTYNLRHHVTQVQLSIARRDTIVLFRICILLIPMLTFCVPSTIVYIIHMLTGYQPWWSFQSEWLSCMLSMWCVNLILAYVSPHVRILWPLSGCRGLRTQANAISTGPARTG